MEYFFLLFGVMFGFHLHSTGEHGDSGDAEDPNAIVAETAGATFLVVVLNNEQLIHG